MMNNPPMEKIQKSMMAVDPEVAARVACGG
jgi:hypothetical protein